MTADIDRDSGQVAGNRPTRDLLLLLPYLPVRGNGEIDYAGAETAVLCQIGANASITMRTIHLGTAAIGRLLVNMSPEIGLGEFSAESMSAIGWLLSELGDLAATAHLLAAACQRHTADYAPTTPKYIPNARP